MLQILSIIFAVIGVINFFASISYSFMSGLIVLLSMLSVAGVMYALGEIASDTRDINNILRTVYADKLEEKASEPFDGEKLMREIEEKLALSDRSDCE